MPDFLKANKWVWLGGPIVLGLAFILWVALTESVAIGHLAGKNHPQEDKRRPDLSRENSNQDFSGVGSAKPGRNKLRTDKEYWQRWHRAEKGLPLPVDEVKGATGAQSSEERKIRPLAPEERQKLTTEIQTALGWRADSPRIRILGGGEPRVNQIRITPRRLLILDVGPEFTRLAWDGAGASPLQMENLEKFRDTLATLLATRLRGLRLLVDGEPISQYRKKHSPPPDQAP